MQITKLKIFGFKSFAQRTEINFPTKGLTAVVGPNGCGKSNITDAIRWVLGEQKAALLRMSKMQDVIFSGTEERAAMSLAEVSIVIDNSDGSLASEYSEVIVTRRVHRDGSGEYLINNQECRLRDVHALLFDSGLGSSTYSQMNADMIKAVLSDKTEERRVLFEEAAGVSKYKQQRKETRRQLERVQIDMERVEDNLRNVRRSVRQYETQAEKVNEYKRFSTRLRELDLSVSIDKFEDYKEGLATLESTFRRMNHEVEAAKTRVTELQTKIDEKALAISEDENNFRDLEHQVQQATIALNDINNSIVRLRDSIATLEAANSKADSEIKTAESRVNDLNLEKDRLEEENAVLSSDNDAEEMSALLERERETLQVMQGNVDDLRSRSRELSNERLNAVNRVNSLKGRFERLDAESALLQQNLEKWNGEVETLQVQKTSAENSIADIQASMECAENEIQNLQEQRTSRGQRLEDEKAGFAELQQKIQGLKQEETRLSSRIDVLESVVNDGNQASRWLLENKPSLVKGLLSERLVADPQYSSQVEAALGDLLDAVVVGNPDDTYQIVDSLKNENVGKALLVLMGNAAEPFTDNLSDSSIVGSLKNFVQVDGDLQAFLNGILSRYFVVDSLQNALELSRKYRSQDFCFVTENAIVRTSGLVSSGVSTSGALSRKNEIAEASELLTKVQGEISSKEDELSSLKDLMDEDALQLSSIDDDLRQKNDELRGGNAAIGIHRNTVLNCERRLGQLNAEIQEAQNRISVADSSKNSDAELAEANAVAERAENEYQSVMDQLSEQEIMLREKSEEVHDLEHSLQDKNSKLAQNTTRLQSIADNLEFLFNNIENRKGEIEKNTASIEKSQEEIDKQADSVEAKDSALRELERSRDAAKERYDVVAGDLEEWRSEERQLRNEQMDKMNELNDVVRRQESLQSNIDRIRERIFSDYNVDLSNTDDIERVEYSQPEADKEIRELRGKIKDLGPINVNVMEDYEDEKKRLEEVEKQFDDLDRARASLDRT
ncbi:MAG: chromosome segregation protein SMC, partial [Fibrobacteraceae bacterium]|nr:chromosome segregation protein SMC [Fibrobacteraceae bacterium]